MISTSQEIHYCELLKNLIFVGLVRIIVLKLGAGQLQPDEAFSGTRTEHFYLKLKVLNSQISSFE